MLRKLAGTLALAACTAGALSGPAPAQPHELDRLIEAGCPERGVPFFTRRPDRELVYPDDIAGAILGLHYGDHVITATRGRADLLVEAVLIRRRDPPPQLRSVFALSRAGIIRKFGSGLDQRRIDKVFRNPRAILYTSDGLLLEIEFESDRIGSLFWQCAIWDELLPGPGRD
jgi:hypothetical protein